MFVVPMTSDASVNDCCIVFSDLAGNSKFCESYGTQKRFSGKNDLQLRSSDS